MQRSGISKCLSCTHLSETPTGDVGFTTCQAYPEGIPLKFIMGTDAHDQEEPGDGGLRYELDPRRQHLLDLYEKQQP